MAKAQYLHMTDLHLSPKTVQLKYPVSPPPCSAPTGSGSPGEHIDCVTWAGLFRDGNYLSQTVDNPKLEGGVWVFDDTTWSYNTRHKYSLQVDNTSYTWTTSGWSSGSSTSYVDIYVTVRMVRASVNQTADTRLDMRFGDPTLKDYKFKDGRWRGGLFAGYNGDNSKVGRTYLKFSTLPGPVVSTDKLWSHGGLAAYCTRLANTGSVSLLCRTGLSNTWDATTLNWSNAPLPKTSGGPAFSIAWDKTNFFGAPGDPNSPPGATDPTGKWATVNFLSDIEEALDSSATALTAILMGENEQSSYNGAPDTTTGGGWAYFAKTGYSEPNQPAGESNLTAYLLYAFGGYGANYDDYGNPTGSGGGGDGGDGGGGYGDFSVKKKNPKPGTKSPVPSSPKAQKQGAKAVTTPGAKP